MTLAMSGATPADAGLASGLVSTTAQVGGALGLALLASVASSHAHGSHTLSAIVGGYHVAFLIGATLVVAVMAVAFIILEGSGAHAGYRGGHRSAASAHRGHGGPSVVPE